MRDFETVKPVTSEEETARQYEFIKKAKEFVAKKEQKMGRKLTFCVQTFGCQMNARDSEKLVGILEQVGYIETEDELAGYIAREIPTAIRSYEGLGNGWLSSVKLMQYLKAFVFISEILL